MKRAAIIAVAAAGVALAVVDYRAYAGTQQRALDQLADYGLEERYPELRAEVRRRYDPVAAELRVAQALLNDELDRSWIAQLPEERARRELERGAERLDRAAEIARRAWPRRAASWQAAMVLGGATYLKRFRDRDPRFMAEREQWELPLRAALELAPTKTGPVRFLASAYLGNWSSLDRAQRSATTELLTRGFEDPKTFQLLIGDWLRVAPSRSRALAPVPERPWAWQILQQHFSTAGDWELYVEARKRWYAALEDDLARSLDEVRSLLEGGEQRDARNRLLLLLERIPRSLEFAPHVERVLALLPPGPVGGRAAESFGAWLSWSFELCLDSECPFDASDSSRLARLAGDLPPAERALAALIGGDLPRAELIERRFAADVDDRWARYYLLKTEHLIEAAEVDLAEESLQRLPSGWRDRPRYWIAAERLAVAQEDAEGVARAEARLAAARGTSWGPRDWTRAGGLYELQLWPSTDAAGVALSVDGATAGGSVAEVFLNGRLLDVVRSSRSAATYRFATPIPATPHRLSVRFHTGGSVRPVSVELL